MNITILTPEEEIMAYMEKALTEELPEIIKTINQEQGYTWIEAINEISKVEKQNSRLPNAVMSISQVKKKIVDINFVKEEYQLLMTVNFKDGVHRINGYRYNYLISRLLKTSTNIANMADKIIVEEMNYFQNQRGDNREPASIVLKIKIIKETT
jgi:hypothetical protein